MATPSQIEQLLSSAAAAHSTGRLEDAFRIAREVLRYEPGNVQGTLLLGVVSAKMGQTDEAMRLFQIVYDRDPKSFESVFWLSILNRRKGMGAEATRFAELATQLRPRDAHAHNNLGLCYLDSMRLAEAASSFQTAIGIRNDLAPVFHNLGTALYMLGRDLEAAKAFDQAILRSPRALDSLLGLGQTLISQTNPGEAVKVARRALSVEPRSAPAHLLMASALVEDSRSHEAEPYLQRAVQLNPSDAQAQSLLGLRLQSLGRFKEANEHLWKSLEAEPNQGFAYFALVFNNKISELRQPLVDRMRELANRQTLSPREQAFLEYGLGRALENLGHYEEAIQHFDEANRLSREIKFGGERFDREAYVASFDWLIKTFSSDYVREHRVLGNPSRLPIVIVGMMRSGTTLIEQILSSHPAVGPAGEQRFWPQNRVRFLGNERGIPDLTVLPDLGREYVAKLKQVSPGFEFVTDKMPANYELAGPIHMALPNAKIIHMKRNPVDTAVSIYATPNRVPIGFAYDRANIVLAYRQYQRLMAHWRVVLPKDRFLEVEYEKLVAERENQVRRIAEFLELPWSDLLLSHEQNERNVITPSLWQVRQPIYSTSVERWRRY